jgi:hypothetical protein
MVGAWLRRHRAPLLGLLGLVLLLFSDVVFFGKVFYERDIHLEWYSQIEGFVRSVASGAWPVWDSTIAFGQPLLADPSAQIAYPPTWLNLFVQPWDYYRGFVLGHCWFAALGMYLLCLHLERSRTAAFAAAGVWILCGPFLSLVSVWHHFAGACWIPWVVLAALRALAAPGLAPTLAWGGAGALQIVAGSAEMAAMGFAASVLIASAVVPWRGRPPRAALSIAGRVLTAAILMASLSAVLWAPTLEVLLRSARAGLPAAVRTLWSVPPIGLARMLLPLPGADIPWAETWQERLFDTVPPFLPSLYLGLPALALVFAARHSSGRTFRWTATLLFVGALALALGRHAPFYGLAVQAFPPLAIFRYPSKAMLLVALAWALLVATGVDEALRTVEARGRATLVALGLLGALTVGIGSWLLSGATGLQSFLAPPPWAESLRAVSWGLGTGIVRAGVALVGVAALLAASRGRYRRPSVQLAVLLCLADLTLAHRSLNLTTSRTLVAFKPPILEGLSPDDHRRLYVYEYFLTPGSSRRYLGREDPYVILPRPGQATTPELKVLSQRLYPFPPVPGRWGLEGSFDVDTRGLYPRFVSTLVSLLRSVEGTPLHHRLLRLGAVRWVIALHTLGFEDLLLEKTVPSLFPEPIRRFAVPDSLPRTYAVGAARAADGPAALAFLMGESFDPTREIVLAVPAAALPSPDFHGTSRIVELKADRVQIEADLSGAGYVVLVDAFDPGWKASLDGRPVPVLRANLAFRAVRVPAGRHRLTMAYRPVGVWVGLGISLTSALGLVAGLGVARLRGRRRGART